MSSAFWMCAKWEFPKNNAGICARTRDIGWSMTQVMRLGFAARPCLTLGTTLRACWLVCSVGKLNHCRYSQFLTTGILSKTWISVLLCILQCVVCVQDNVLCWLRCNTWVWYGSNQFICLRPALLDPAFYFFCKIHSKTDNRFCVSCSVQNYFPLYWQ